MSDFDDREEEHDEDEDDIEYTIKVSWLSRRSRESDSIYGFQKIIGKRKNGRTYEYQVVWSGCDEDTATWEPEDNLQNAKAMISNFERSKSPTQNITLKRPKTNDFLYTARRSAKIDIQTYALLAHTEIAKPIAFQKKSVREQIP